MGNYSEVRSHPALRDRTEAGHPFILVSEFLLLAPEIEIGCYISLEAIRSLGEFNLLGSVMQAPCAFYEQNQLVIDKSIYFVENSSIFCASFRFSRGNIYEVD